MQRIKSNALWAKGSKQESHESHVDNKKASAYPEMTPKCSLFFYRISLFLCFVFIGVPIPLKTTPAAAGPGLPSLRDH